MKRIRTVKTALRTTLIPALPAFTVVLCGLHGAAIRVKAYPVIPAIVQTDNNLLLPDDHVLFHIIDYLVPAITVCVVLIYIFFLIRKMAKTEKEGDEEIRKYTRRPENARRWLSTNPEKDLQKRINGNQTELPVTCPYCGAIGYTDKAGNCKYCGRSIKKRR